MPNPEVVTLTTQYPGKDPVVLTLPAEEYANFVTATLANRGWAPTITEIDQNGEPQEIANPVSASQALIDWLLENARREVVRYNRHQANQGVPPVTFNTTVTGA